MYTLILIYCRLKLLTIGHNIIEDEIKIKNLLIACIIVYLVS